MITRSEVVIRRTYSRPLNEAETLFETWEQICHRVMEHQRWLWERAKGPSTILVNDGEGKKTKPITVPYTKLTKEEEAELLALKELSVQKKVSMSGRTLWLGGTNISKVREASQFNCSGTIVETVYDVVDVLWLLMQGCFDPNTKIQTPTGLKRLGDINIGDEVIAYNEKTGEFVTETVLNKQISLKQEKLSLEFCDSYMVECTEDHEFLTERGWVQAKDLLETDIFRYKDSQLKLWAIQPVINDVNYIDITVSNSSTFILENGAVVHNCGVGFKPKVGTLNGFFKPIKNIKVIGTTRTKKGGRETNKETWDQATKTWTISVGDSAEAWAKSIGKLLAGKYPAETLVFDFSELRPAGCRLTGYGWISSGDSAISKAYVAIAGILNKKAGELLSRIDILDIVNWLGTILSSRRSAEIALFEYGQPEWEEFAIAKKEFWNGNIHRSQSNNSLVFNSKPSREELLNLFRTMEETGGSEPGFINGEAALAKAPWFNVLNPCAEVLLPNKGFCNLVEIDVSKFIGDTAGLHEALRLAARANYRQTCVNLGDGILQESWHLNNVFLRLCGVGLTGIAQRPDLLAYDLSSMQRAATHAAYSMADKLGLQRPKNVCLGKPSGTLSKVFMCPEGIHVPLGKYIFNNINFGRHDPLLPALRDAGYNVWDNPADPEGILVTFPVHWEHVPFTKVQTEHGVLDVNLETAVQQLNRYKKYQVHWSQQNMSNTISYEPSEVYQIVDWLMENWDIYVGVSFFYRADPTKTAKDLGYLYLPQEVVSKEVYAQYVSRLRPFVMPSVDTNDNEISSQEACAGGVCPVK